MLTACESTGQGRGDGAGEHQEESRKRSHFSKALESDHNGMLDSRIVSLGYYLLVSQLLK